MFRLPGEGRGVMEMEGDIPVHVCMVSFHASKGRGVTVGTQGRMWH